jgi:2-methylisocitrate lyase-like PEP mutase family enzyme
MSIAAEQARQAEAFRARHRAGSPLLLCNAWDGMSARIFAAAGFEAIATSSGGLAWSLGYPDGEIAPWAMVVGATERIVQAARLPVTADIEEGYAETADRLAVTVCEIIATGVVGINLEDGRHHGSTSIREADAAAERIRAARKAASSVGVPIVINARIDVWQRKIGEEGGRFDEAVRRARAYREAGADCVFPIGLRDFDTIARFVKAVDMPVNIVAKAGMPPLAEFARIGVARISTASAPALVIMAKARELATALKTGQAFDALASPLTHAEAQRLFARS